MGSDSLKLKVSYLVVALDKRKAAIDRSYLKLLFDENDEVISRTVSSLPGKDAEKQILKELHSQYINYDFDYVYKTLCGFRTFQDLCEVCYITNVNYMPDFYKAGNLYTLDEIQERNILIEEYYGELVTKFRTHTFR
jgi:hypothetical protein